MQKAKQGGWARVVGLLIGAAMMGKSYQAGGQTLRNMGLGIQKLGDASAKNGGKRPSYAHVKRTAKKAANVKRHRAALRG